MNFINYIFAEFMKVHLGQWRHGHGQLKVHHWHQLDWQGPEIIPPSIPIQRYVLAMAVFIPRSIVSNGFSCFQT